MHEIFITRSGQRYGPYTQGQCEQMLAAGHLIPLDMAWRSGMPQWRPLGEVVPNNFRMVSAPVFPMALQSNLAAPIDGADESAAAIFGQMGCGCVVWVGLLILALAGGVVFPLLLLALPFVFIGGVVDLVKKIIMLSKRGDKRSGTT